MDLALAERLEFRTNFAFAESCQDRFLFARRERNALQVDDVACAGLCEGRERVSDLMQERRDIARGNSVRTRIACSFGWPIRS